MGNTLMDLEWTNAEHGYSMVRVGWAGNADLECVSCRVMGRWFDGAVSHARYCKGKTCRVAYCHSRHCYVWREE